MEALNNRSLQLMNCETYLNTCLAPEVTCCSSLMNKCALQNSRLALLRLDQPNPFLING